VKSYWEVCRHRIAPGVADGLEELLQSGQLTYYAGRIQTCQPSDHGVEVTVCQRNTKDQINFQVQRIINCTGSNCDYSKLQHPLVVSLQEQRLIRPHVLTGIDTAAEGEIIDADGNISNWLYTLGTARKGNLWETTAVPELRVQAQALALTLLRSPSINTIRTDVIFTPAIVNRDRPTTYSASFKPSLIFRQLFDPTSSTYTYLIGEVDSRQAILVDPVWEQVERDLRVLRELSLTLHFCLETHVHADHITGANELRSCTGCQIVVPQQANVTEVDRWIADNEILQLGRVRIRSVATPGHTDSHMVYLVNDTHLLSGDTLLIRGCGRTDFQGGDAGLLYDVVIQELFNLPDDTLIYPAHDYQGQTVSTIGEEKLWNPRFAGRDRAQFINLMASLRLPYPKKMREAISANQRCGATLAVSAKQRAEESDLDKELTEQLDLLIPDDSPVFLGMYI
jgi:glyoxylase-like metal-dependent hydrolase (beta-lactamase superfamily II)